MTIAVCSALVLWAPCASFWRSPLASYPSVRPELGPLLDHLRDHTPSPGERLESDVAPQWGVLAHWDLGHWILGVAERPVVVNNFGSHLGERWQQSENWFNGVQGEAAALEMLDDWKARYVITHVDPGLMSQASLPFAQRLHLGGGSDGAWGAGSGGLQLVVETKGGGRRPSDGQTLPNFRLFRRVAGATLDLAGDPGTELAVETHWGPLRYRRRAVVEADGMARVRVAYPGQYRIDSDRTVDVPATAVTQGTVIPWDVVVLDAGVLSTSGRPEFYQAGRSGRSGGSWRAPLSTRPGRFRLERILETRTTLE